MADTDIDIVDTWRRLRRTPGEAPRVNAHLDSADGAVSVTIAQECQVSLPSGNRFPEVTVTITSHRPGVAAQVTAGANLNSPDGNYQGPTTAVGSGQFTTANPQVQIGFIVLPSGWSVLGVGAKAVWADGAPNSLTLDYVHIACNPWVWWQGLIPIVGTLRGFSRNSSG